MDLEGFARRKILEGYDHQEIIKELKQAIKEFKDWSEERNEEFSKAVLDEVITSESYKKIKDTFLRRLLGYPTAEVKMGEFGVGSRGEGDFFVHRKIADILGSMGEVIGPQQQDDAGVVKGSGRYLTVSIDGMHSRLSEFPFLAGFHVARAALRDVYVMGSKPVALISDLHLGDDGDIGKLLDFTAGVSTISELTGVPTVAGSTLRIGGDMVFGDRLVAAVGAVGTSSERPKARKNAEESDVILITEGKGGGTITTIAIYNGYFDTIKVTLNVEFMKACETIMQKGHMQSIHAMTDVTNGGLRGDAIEISRTSKKKLIFYEEMLNKFVNPEVMKMLKDLNIDPLGISTDSLLLILPEKEVEDVKKCLNEVTKTYEIGRVESGKGVKILGEGETELKPLFREAPYTKIKKIIGEKTPQNVEKMKENIEKAKKEAVEKKKEIIKFIGGGSFD
jgi:hydrogenase expression/formation protein